MKLRLALGGLVLSAAAFVGILTREGYEEVAKPPVPGDVPTNGFGSTGVKLGEKTNPVKAVNRALLDVQMYEGAVKRCIRVPLYQHEYDAYISLAYNIGPTAFCNSTLAKLVNQERYTEGCREILRWDKFHGKPLRGLTIRRQAEFKQCMGG